MIPVFNHFRFGFADMFCVDPFLPEQGIHGFNHFRAGFDHDIDGTIPFADWLEA